MNSSLMCKRLIAAMLVTGSITLAGCKRANQELSGTYTYQPPSRLYTLTVEFKSGRKVFASALGQTRECTYTVESDKAIFDCGTGRGKEVYTILGDSSLTSGTGSESVTLRKKK